MIEPLAGASAAPRPDTPPPSTTSVGTAGGFDDAYADAVAPPEGGCQCDRTPSTAPATSTNGPSAARSPSIPSTFAALRPATSSLVVTGGDDVLGLLDAQNDPSIDPFRTPTCGQCGLPFVLDDDGAPSPETHTAPLPTVPLVGTSWTPINPRWIRPAD